MISPRHICLVFLDIGPTSESAVWLVFTVDLTGFGTAVGNGVCVCDGVSRKGLTEEGRLTWIWAALVHGPGSWESEPSISAHLSLLLCLRLDGWWDLGEWSLQMRLIEDSGDSQLYPEHRTICTLRVKKTHKSKVHNCKDMPHMAKTWRHISKGQKHIPRINPCS